MRRVHRESRNQRLAPQQSKVYFNVDDPSPQCAICYRQDQPLINPCQCQTYYHQQCILIYIQKRILRQLKQKEEMDISTLKCLTCNRRFYILFTHQIQRSCSVMCSKLSNNCCNKHLIILCIVIILIIVTATLAAVLIPSDMNKVNTGLKYGIISALVLQILIFLVVLYSFLQNYLTVRKVMLQKVYDMTDLRSFETDNSEDNKITEEQQILIKN